MAYELELPATARIYPVFHVGLLQRYKGPLPPSSSKFPSLLLLEDQCETLRQLQESTIPSLAHLEMGESASSSLTITPINGVHSLYFNFLQ